MGTEPDIRQTDTHIIVTLPADRLFAANRTTIDPSANALLYRTAQLIREAAPGPVEIAGHTDDRRAAALGEAVSLQQARAVADWLGLQVGVRPRQITSAGRGATEPLVATVDEEARARNRRIEIAIPRG